MERKDTTIRLDRNFAIRLKTFSKKNEHKSMEQTIISNMEVAKQVKKAKARWKQLEREYPEIYETFIGNIFN